jgi:hypothetical protein
MGIIISNSTLSRNRGENLRGGEAPSLLNFPFPAINFYGLVPMSLAEEGIKG